MTLAALTLGVAMMTAGAPDVKAKLSVDPEPGQLTIIGRDGKPGALVPLERTSVVADIAGIGARVKVVQTFQNTSETPIEAIYTFPLPGDAAVDQMRMKIGDRVIEGEIKKRDEARAIYNLAKASGQAAALLDQERPNIFTQSVANIMPGAKIRIELGYAQTLDFEAGNFKFIYPMVVGPRFLGQAPDPGKISPPVTPKGQRTGTNIDLKINIEAGAKISSWSSPLHKVKFRGIRDGRATVELAKADEIPNRDFELRYSISDATVRDAVFVHPDGDGKGTFSIVMTPPVAPTESQVRNREIIFVIDQSGSQGGFPIEKSKELALKMMSELRPGDTFNVVGFNNSVLPLWPKPRPLTPNNEREARAHIREISANGGTMLWDAVKFINSKPAPEGRLRLVLFNTDGYVGNDAQILDEIQKGRALGRYFTFGIGNSVNRALIDSMASEGRGVADYAYLSESADSVIERFRTRMKSPVLTDIQVSVDGVPVTDLTPKYVPDLFGSKPIVIYGRYEKAGGAMVTIRGMLGNQPYSHQILISLPASGNASSAVTSLWARRTVDDLSRQNFLVSSGYLKPVEKFDASTLTKQITDIGLKFGIMTQFTSFVAVEKRVVNVGGKQRTVAVPVERVPGLANEMYDGGEIGGGRRDMSLAKTKLATSFGVARGSGGYGGGAGGFGGAGASPAAPGGISFISHDPTDNSLISTGQGTPAAKIAAKLKGKKGDLEVQIRLTDLTEKTLKKLKELGFKLDDQDKSNKTVFGVIDAAKLDSLGKLTEVVAIDPI